MELRVLLLALVLALVLLGQADAAVSRTLTEAVQDGGKQKGTNNNKENRGRDDDEDDDDDDDDDDDEDEEEDDDEDKKGDDDGEVKEVLDYRICEQARDSFVSDWIDALEEAAEECGIASLDDSNLMEVLAAPADFVDQTLLCSSSCLRTVFVQADQGKGLVGRVNRILQTCGGPMSRMRSHFFGEKVFGNTTWADVRDNYKELQKLVGGCAPDSLGDKQLACQELADAVSELLDSDEGQICETARTSMTDQDSTEAFCKEKRFLGQTCYDLYKEGLRRIAKAGCGEMDLVRDMRTRLAGACVRQGSDYCYPEFSAWMERDVHAEIDALLDADNLDGAKDLVNEVCDSKCLRKVAKEQDVWKEADSSLELLCKRDGGRGNGNNGEGEDEDEEDNDPNDGMCYLRFAQAMEAEDDVERVKLLCSDRCFGKIARSIISDLATTPEVRDMLQATIKYLCVKDPENNDDDDDDDDDEEEEEEEDEQDSDHKGRCLARVADAEEELSTACATAAAEGECSEECRDALPGWLKRPRGNCCLASTLAYREKVWEEEDATDSITFWTNLTDACELDVVETPCAVALARFKRRKRLRLCGLAASLLEDEEVVAALKEDIMANFGISEENLENVIVSIATEGCGADEENDGAAAGDRRRLEGGSVDVSFDLLGQDEEDLDNIFYAVDEDDMVFPSTIRAVGDDAESPSLSAEVVDDDGSDGGNGDNSSASRTTAAMLAVLASLGLAGL